MRQNGVQLFLLGDMQPCVASLTGKLMEMGAVDKILGRIQKCSTKPNDFLVLIKSLTASEALISVLQEEVLWKLRQRVGPDTLDGAENRSQPSAMHRSMVDPMAVHYIDFVQSILDRCNLFNVQDLLGRIMAVVDEEATTVNGMVVVRHGFDEMLDQMKDQYARLGDILWDCGRVLAEKYPRLRNYITIMFIPQLGFLVCVKHHYNWDQEGAIPEDFQFVFTEDSKTYFKNYETKELDCTIGDLDACIRDAEALIVSHLEDVILDSDQELRSTCNALAELDCIIAFASCAADLKFVRPIMVPAAEQCILIRNGRHPLQELMIDDEFIPNDVHIDEDSRVNVVTGPNFSGKSCYARQIGLLTYMAHLGCFLPCDGAQISVVDHILARFSSVETCAVPQSSFQLDLSKTGNILRRAGPGSLVIIDEFGKGEPACIM